MQRFELSEGKSHKFWQIAIDGRAITVRYGRIGTDGQTMTKKLASADAAKREHDKLVNEKTRKGYVPVGKGTKARAKVAKAARAPAKAKKARGEATKASPRVEAFFQSVKGKAGDTLRELRTRIERIAPEAHVGLVMGSATYTIGKSLYASVAPS